MMMGELVDEFIFNYISFLEFLTLLICNVIIIKKGYRPKRLINKTFWGKITNNQAVFLVNWF